MKRLLLFLLSALFVLSACSSSPDPRSSLNVKVVDWQGTGVANATVVIGTESGAMTTALSTDERGEASLQAPPAIATVTAAFGCVDPLAGRTYYSAAVVYGVTTAAVTLTVGTCSQDAREVNINVTDAIPGIADRQVTLGPITYGGAGTVTMSVTGAVQDDGAISVFATGFDEAGSIKGYGLALDRPARDGTIIDIAIDRTDLLTHTHRFSNVPSAAAAHFFAASLMRRHAMTSLPFNFVSDTGPLPDRVTSYSAAGFSDGVMLDASVTLAGSETPTIRLTRHLMVPSDQLFDFSAAPLVPTGLTYDPGTAGRPVISWSNQDPRATTQSVTLSHRSTAPKISFYYSLTAPASAARLVFPELPAELAAFRPGASGDLTLTAMKFEKPVSYADYLNAAVAHNGRFYETAGLNSYGTAQVSRKP